MSNAALECPICLEPSPVSVAPHRRSARQRLVFWLVLPLLFMGTCTALLRPAARLADPMTNAPLSSVPDMPFPVLVMNGDAPRIVMLRDPHALLPLRPGESFLVPDGKDEQIERRLQDPTRDGRWVLRVARLALDRQQIELYRMNDGYAGGAYEATATSITPNYRKITGPGFAFVAGGLAMLLSAALWLPVVFFWWRRSGGRRTSVSYSHHR